MEVVAWLMSALLMTTFLAIAALAPQEERPVRKPIPVRIDDGEPRR